MLTSDPARLCQTELQPKTTLMHSEIKGDLCSGEEHLELFQEILYELDMEFDPLFTAEFICVQDIGKLDIDSCLPE